VNSRDKGKRGEREWAEFLRDYFGLQARRGVQYSGGPLSPDVVGGWRGTHPEVKFTQSFQPDKWIEQAERDAANGTIPYVAYRANRKPWLVIVKAEDLVNFVEAVTKGSRLERAHRNPVQQSELQSADHESETD
jgi:Holliday junction resolvase